MLFTFLITAEHERGMFILTFFYFSGLAEDRSVWKNWHLKFVLDRRKQQPRKHIWSFQPSINVKLILRQRPYTTKWRLKLRFVSVKILNYTFNLCDILNNRNFLLFVNLLLSCSLNGCGGGLSVEKDVKCIKITVKKGPKMYTLLHIFQSCPAGRIGVFARPILSPCTNI